MIDPSNRKEVNRLIDEYNIQFHSERGEEIAIAHLTTLLEALCKQDVEVDFDDMIWLPLVNNYPFSKYDVLFVDEAQDFNKSRGK